MGLRLQSPDSPTTCQLPALCGGLFCFPWPGRGWGVSDPGVPVGGGGQYFQGWRVPGASVGSLGVCSQVLSVPLHLFFQLLDLEHQSLGPPPPPALPAGPGPAPAAALAAPQLWPAQLCWGLRILVRGSGGGSISQGRGLRP